METEINTDAKAAIDACFEKSARMDVGELSHLVDALIQRSERFISRRAKRNHEISKYENRDESVGGCRTSKLEREIFSSRRNVIWGPASLHLATTATSCVQIETLKIATRVKKLLECLRVVAEAVLLKRGSGETRGDRRRGWKLYAHKT